MVRRWFVSEGTLDDNTVLPVNGLGVDHLEVIRSVAVAGHVPLIDPTLYNEKRDNTPTSVCGATVHAGLVRDALVAQDLVPEGLSR